MSDIVSIRWEDGIERVVETILAIVTPEKKDNSLQLQTKVYGKIYQALTHEDYFQQITNIYSDYPPQSIRTALTLMLFNEQINPRMRTRAL